MGKYAHLNPNDVVFTPDWLAKQIVDMFPIEGKVLEPCKGEGALFNLTDEKWYSYSHEQGIFVICEIPILTKNFAGVGTRTIESYNIIKDGEWVVNPTYLGEKKEKVAIKAIKDVYKKTFKNE